MPVIVAVLYLSVDRGQNVENHDIIQCITEDVGRWGSNREVLVMGDFNGHVQLIDGYQDRNGGLMLQLAERLSLEVANLRPDCIGETTWSARNSRSCIDYALTSPNLTAHMTRVHVDESGQFSLGSDHNRIALTFSASAHRVHRTDRCKSVRQYLPATSFERVAGDFEKSGIHMRQTTYAEFIDELHHTMRRYEKRVHSRGGTKRKAWWDQQVKTALEARRAANRAHRNAARSLSTEECHQAWQEFLKRKKDMQQIVQKKITESNQKQLRTITEAGRSGPQKFWAYISSLDREAPRPILRDAAGEEVTDAEEHLTAYMQQLYNSSIPVQQVRSTVPRDKERERGSTPADCDPVPEDWLRGRVCLIPKKGGRSAQLQDYRPLTVTSVLYRSFMQVIKSWMNAWAEKSGTLTELQNGFRQKRRVEDNLFVLMQCIEIARKESRGLLACFLDVAKAYDSVPHNLLLSRMDDLGMPPVWIDLLRRLYTASLEHALLNLDVGFTLNFSFDSTPTTWTIPGLVFADDLVLLAENEAQLQQLVETSAKHLGTLGLAFNSRKSAVVQFSGDRENPTMVLPDGERLPAAEEYRYLGVVLSASDGVNAEHEAHLRQSAQRASRILRRQCLWGCSRYLMVRELWKSVHVPGLTFANSTICLTAPTRDWLERGQREVGRLALGCHGRVAVEAIQGDVGWSSFEAREAKSKIAFECRLRNMDDARWARRVFRYVYLKGIQTQWRSRVQFLRRKYGLLNYSETGGARCETAKGVQDHVRETERELWKSAMASKTTLRLYCDNKGTITPEPIYDNSGGSALLFEARAGALRTLDYRSRFDCAPEVQAAVCRVCGSERETAEHLVLNCAKLSPTPKEGTTMPQALGFLDVEVAAASRA
ncbi:uncharacterized protein LOC119435064 [Dermacentor silvarum]|uniref:uncharacterized protein LOC119435064 n=1 Tax=Dermacentor silvarum TaxID=543639 RepID=UPI00189BC3F3|nr:uncharacterized protein LOC119435064 [Dermacentor silvarum]